MLSKMSFLVFCCVTEDAFRIFRLGKLQGVDNLIVFCSLGAAAAIIHKGV
jgi:hypothetical protein